MNLNVSRYYIWMVYTILWGMVWTYPVLVVSVGVIRDGYSFSWDDILRAWSNILPYFLIFLLHRIPVSCLLMRHRTRVYSLSVILLIGLFAGYRYWSMQKYHPRVPAWEEPIRFPGRKPSAWEWKNRDADGQNPDKGQYVMKECPDSIPMPFVPNGHFPRPFVFPGIWIIDVVIAILMLGFDLGIVLLSRYQQEQDKERQLEALHLQHELEYLKGQISPHFFMNMLNNIHGMVELNPVQAQAMIMELSKLMRYVLYEGSKPYTTLLKETEFITSYVELMRKRYSSKKVCIRLHVPDTVPEHIRIPPLLFISIIENAFKHGISYRNSSFVEISLKMEGSTVCMECVNSVHGLSGQKGPKGIGLVNLRQRLQLLYNHNFTLEINETESVYHVKLIIPCEYETDTMPGSR